MACLPPTGVIISPTIAHHRRREFMKSTFTKILDASEKQFALYGVEGVSLRQIIAAAGVSQGSLHYHFGGKEGLLEAILERCLPPLMDERAAMLTALAEAGREPSVRELLGVIVLPLARRFIEGGAAGKRTVFLLARLYHEQNAIYLRATEKYFRQIEFTYLKKLQAALPALSRRQVELRVQISSGAVFATLIGLERTPLPWQTELSEDPLSAWQTVEELMDFLAQGLQSDQGR